MKIVQFGYSFLPITGGEEHWVNEFSRFLESSGYDTVFIQRGFRSEFPDGRPKKVSERITATPVSFLAPKTVNGPVWDRQPLYNLLGFLRLWKTVKRGDVVVVVYPQLYFPSVWLVSKLKGVKVICASVGITWDGSNKSWKEKLLYAMVKFLEKRALRGADKCVGIDTRYLREMQRFDAKAARKVGVVCNFVMTDFYSPVKVRRERFVLCPRNLRYARGVDLAIRGMRIVNGRFKDVKLLILGDGPIKGELEQLIRELGVNAEIRPFVGKEELRELYRRASIVVVPSRYSEGSSFAAIEAMSCGTPIVVTDVGGLPDVVVDGYNGFMVKPVADEVGSAMLKILNDAELASSMSVNGRKLALEKFSYAKFCEGWKAVLGEVVQK